MSFGQIKRKRRELTAQVATLAKELGTLRERAEPLATALLAHWTAARNHSAHALAEQSKGIRQAVTGQDFAAVAPWDDEMWGVSFEGEAPSLPEPSLLRSVRIGRVTDAAGAGLHASAALDVPYFAPLIGAPGPIVLVCDAASAGRARALLQSLLLRIELGVPRASFTLLDPEGLGAAFPLRGALGKARTTSRQPADELNAVLDDIRRLNEDVLHGQTFHSLDPKRLRSEYFEFVLAADFPFAYERSHGAIESLLKIAKSGPHAGRYVIIEHRVDKPLQHSMTSLEIPNAFELDLRKPSAYGFAVVPDEAPDTARQRDLLGWYKTPAKSGGGGSSWDEVIAPKELWTERSVERIVTPIGHEPLRLLFGEDESGRACAHGVLAGTTGAGKSNLLNVLVTGLAARYSPDELRLVLVDGKHGVTFEAFRNLPHAEAVSLRTSPELARSVLADFCEEMKQRYLVFQRAGVQSLKEYREKNPTVVMPRMLLVVDEYQQLVTGDNGEGAKMLNQVAEQGRAAGIHMLLGALQFQPDRVPSSMFNQMHLLIAMKLAPTYVQSLTLFKPQGKALISDLDQRGLVVVNNDGGKDGSNTRGSVAHLPEAALSAVLGRIIAKAGPSARRPVVMDGSVADLLAANPHVRRWAASAPAPQELEQWARRNEREGGFGDPTFSWAERPLTLWLGREFNVHGHASVVLRRRPSDNVVLVGADNERRGALLASSLVALAATVGPQDLEIEIVDGLHPGLPGAGYLGAAADFLAARGYRARCVGAQDAAAVVSAAVQALRARAGAAMNQPSRLVVLSTPENLTALHAPDDPFGVPDGAAAELRELIKNGPAAGIHLVVAAGTVDQLDRVIQTRRRELRMFSHRVCQQVSESDSVVLLESPAGARVTDKTGHDAAALYVDMAGGSRAGVLFKTYAIHPTDPYASGVDALRDSFTRAYAPSSEPR